MRGSGPRAKENLRITAFDPSWGTSHGTLIVPWAIIAFHGKTHGNKSVCRGHWTIPREYFHRFDMAIGVVIVLAAAWFVRNRWKNRLRGTSV